MQKPQVRLKLSVNQGTVNLPLQKLVTQIEKVIYTVIRPVSPSAFRSNPLRNQTEYLFKVEPAELSFNLC